MKRIETSNCVLDISHIVFPKDGKCTRIKLHLTIVDAGEDVFQTFYVDTSLDRGEVKQLIIDNVVVEPKIQSMKLIAIAGSYNIILNEKMNIIIL